MTGPGAPTDPQRPAASAEAWLASIRRQVLQVGVGVALAMGTFFFALRAPVTALGCVGVAATLGVGVWRLERTRHPERLLHALLAISHVALWVLGITEPRFDVMAVAWLGVLPFAAMLVLPPRAALAWLGVTAALVLAAPWAHDAVLLPWQSVTLPRWAPEARAVALIATLFFFALRFELARRQLVAAYEAASRTKSTFLANVSHEIRTPMNGVMGLTELLLAEARAPEEHERLALLHRSSQAMVALINELLDMSRIEAGKFSLDVVDFDLERLLDDLRQLYTPAAQRQGLELRMDLDPAVLRCLRGDALRLRQVLTNLLSNALKFTERGEVSLSVRLAGATKHGQRVRFEVRDTGAGIAPDTLPRLFQPFEQGDASTTRKQGGSGLGLALSRELVRLMGGELDVETRAQHGSRFHFELELSPGVLALALPSVSSESPAPARTSLPVLVVDDNPINLKVACALVERLGYPTVPAVNGALALEAVQQQPFAVVLMDCHMPVMDGFEATERIRALDGPGALVPVIAVTASAMPDEVQRCYQAGMNECLAKPVSLGTLQAVLSRVERYRAQASTHATA